MPFYNREKDIERLKAILSGEPNLVHFIYGPINSGKTALLNKVFDELPENYRVFYVNFRARDVESVEALMKVLFRVREGSKRLSQFLKDILKEGSKIIERIGGIPIPEEIFNLLFVKKEKVEDIFAFLEEYFREVVEKGIIPILALDEIQTIKDVINATGKPILGRLFNFLVRLTKETHLCHALCATSDCLFIEDIYSSARLEGRSDYVLVDDMGKEEAFRMYEYFGFRDRETIWDYIGGKVGDMVRLTEEKKKGLNEKEGLEAQSSSNYIPKS